jgi:hypothetical protein
MHDNNRIGTLDCGESVSDHNGSSSLQKFPDCLLDKDFRFRIDTGGGFIKDEYRGMDSECAGEGDKLFLPDGKGGTPLFHLGIVLSGHPFDEALCPDHPGCRTDAVDGDVFVAEINVGFDVSGEEKDVLEYNCHMPPKVSGADGPDICAVDEDLTPLELIETAEEIDDGPVTGIANRNSYIDLSCR